MTTAATRLRSFAGHLIGWVDSWSGSRVQVGAGRRVHWARVAPFVFLHLGCLGVLWVGWSLLAVTVAVGFYLLRAFFITGFYHRYFSHRTFKTSRLAQLLFAVLGNTAVQRGPLWWAAQHRVHHQHSDDAGDPHSPHVHGLVWSHMGWLTAQENFPTDLKRIPDLARYPELCWLDRFDTLVPAVVAVGMYGLGEAFGIGGMQMVIWGFFISTTILLHATCLVNSAAHSFGRRPFATRDHSRNSLIVAILTLGEGWHNNHHRYPASTRQGFTIWEVDVTYYILKLFSWIGLIWELHPVPAHVMKQRALRRKG